MDPPEKQSHSPIPEAPTQLTTTALQPITTSSSASTSTTDDDLPEPSAWANGPNGPNEPNDLEKQSSRPSRAGGTLSNILSRTLSRTSNLPEPGPPPDGGLQAWTQAIMAHLVIFNTWGFISSYGVFQNYYVDLLGQPPSAISWVGSVQIFLLFFIGTFSGRLTDAGYFRPVFAAGSVLVLLGVFMTSLCTRYWQLFLAQGVLTGIGDGLLFCPTLALLPTYFTSHRSIAFGIAASGSATGGMVFPAIAVRMLPAVGFGWTIRTMGFVVLALQLVAWTFLKPRLPPRKAGPLVELAAFSEGPYLAFAAGMFLAFWGLYTGFYYVGEYADAVLQLPQTDSIYLLLVMNGVGMVGRLIPNYLADRFTGPLNLLIPCALGTAALLFGWIGVESRSGIFAFATIYGLVSAGVQSLFPATLSSLTSDVKKMGVRMGMVFTTVSFATLTGSPIFGALVTRGGGNYLYAQVYAGSALLLGACLLCTARIAKTGWALKVRM